MTQKKDSDFFEKFDRDLESILTTTLPPTLAGHVHSGISPDFEGVFRVICTKDVDFITLDDLIDNDKVKTVEMVLHEEKYLNVVYSKGMQEKPYNHKDGFFLYPIDNYNAMIGHIAQFFLHDKMPLANFDAGQQPLH